MVSPTLSPPPPLAISSSAKNHLIFSKRLGLDFLENGDKQAKGRVMRLLPPDFPVTEVSVEKVFRNSTINYTSDPGRYTPDQGYLYLNQELERMSDASASEIRFCVSEARAALMALWTLDARARARSVSTRAMSPICTA